MRILGLAVGPRIRCLGIVTAAALVISGTSVGGAAADDTPADPAAEQSVANSTQAPGVAVPDALLEGASSDEEAISAAAASFDASEPGSAVELTQAASAADEVALQATPVGARGERCGRR